MENKLPIFMYLVSGTDPENALMVNLAQVKMVDQITDSSLRLLLDPNIDVTVRGEKSVTEVLGLLGRHCITPDGTPLPEALAKARDNQKPEQRS